jgi:hypothetical protein
LKSFFDLIFESDLHLLKKNVIIKQKKVGIPMIKKIDDLGRIAIPKEWRRKL